MFRYDATITGRPDQLTFMADRLPEADFETNRTGFVVLHPLVGVAGAPVTIERVDGSVVAGRFPEAIDPVQPMIALRTLTHEPLPGLTVACRMEGDTFEMEDQRNWTDASYRTYVRPLAPAVARRAAGRRGGAAGGDAHHRRRRRGRRPGRRHGVPCARRRDGADAAGRRRAAAAEIPGTLARLDLLAAMRPRQVVYHCDPRAGGLDGLADAADIARRFGAESAIAMRLNPYGTAPMANPKGIRQAMNEDDPRQRGLFAAAWTVGYAAVAVPGGAAALTFGGTTGPHGVAGDALYPVFHAIRALVALADRPVCAVESSDPGAVAGIAATTTAARSSSSPTSPQRRKRWRRRANRTPSRCSTPTRSPPPQPTRRRSTAAGRSLTLAAFAGARIVSA